LTFGHSHCKARGLSINLQSRHFETQGLLTVADRHDSLIKARGLRRIFLLEIRPAPAESLNGEGKEKKMRGISEFQDRFTKEGGGSIRGSHFRGEKDEKSNETVIEGSTLCISRGGARDYRVELNRYEKKEKLHLPRRERKAKGGAGTEMGHVLSED